MKVVPINVVQQALPLMRRYDAALNEFFRVLTEVNFDVERPEFKLAHLRLRDAVKAWNEFWDGRALESDTKTETPAGEAPYRAW
jgi:uncharacterized protein YdiU (UPF0061 family)